MNWEQLLTAKRTGQENLTVEKSGDRTQFQRDFDRLIFSSPFRRLQDKTQVFPLPGSIFVHNRLTHSLEVSSVGRSLGNNISRLLVENKIAETDLVYEIGSVVAAACLAHDLGNPPFGHSGEKAISHYFSNGYGSSYKGAVTDAQWNDLINFEGNANAFRILTTKFHGRRTGGFALTYSTVASILKYPYSSSSKGKKKYGYFQSEEITFKKIVKELGLIELEQGVYSRHPLVYLVEAADDICYQFMDIEDAHKLKILSTDETKALLLSFFDSENDLSLLKKIYEVFTEVTDTNEQITYLRAIVIGKLVQACTDIFWSNRKNILDGTFEGALVDHLPGLLGKAMVVCQNTAIKRIYRHQSVVEIEIAGFKILGVLLDEFIKAVLNPKLYYSKLLLPFIPEQFQVTEEASVYKKIQTVLDFVSGMTDVYALELFRKIKGMGLSINGF
ncbi:MAG: deoxyguanosinetriphosphate triphosphohydrolase [Marinilabiliaceae bacterium]|nr:deoxyguanosinetriphosphate triphosphohydrolase [Marinilabiliaceae bacterium]